MRFYPFAVLAPLLSLSLVGCPGPSYMMTSPPMSVSDYPGRVPYPSPSATAYPYQPDVQPSAAPVNMDGLSLDDAHQQVRRYLTLHYPGAELVSVQSTQVGANARIPRQSTWAFTYQMKQATPSSPSVQAVEIPSQFESQYLTFTLSGSGVLQAPEAKKRLGHDSGSVHYDQVLPLIKALEIAKSFGMGMGPLGVSVNLKPDSGVGAVYEFDNSLSSSSYGGNYGAGNSYRGKFVIDAYTGDLVERPTNF
ncbi:hypothetical protein D3C87_1055290 [compost metagenome]